MIAAARPGGAVVVEDLDHSAVFAEPRCAALDEFVALYNGAARRRGGDPEIGPRLPTMLLGVGLADVQVHVVQPVFMTGDAKRIHQITLENIAVPVVAAGLASEAELGDLVARLSAFADDPGTMMSFPRIFQVFGRRSSRAGTSARRRHSVNAPSTRSLNRCSSSAGASMPRSGPRSARWSRT